MGKYHTIEGKWISATPKILEVSGPTHLDKILGTQVNLTSEIDWAHSGLYEEEHFRSNQRLELGALTGHRLISVNWSKP